MNSELWGTSAAPLCRFLYCCLTTSHLLLSILLPIQELSHRAQLHHRLRSLGEKAHLNSLSSSLLPHARGWQSSVHQSISAPGNYCLWATPLSQSQGFGLVKLCFLSDVQLSQTVFLFQQRVLRVSRRKPVSPYGWCCHVLIIVLYTSVMGRFI